MLETLREHKIAFFVLFVLAVEAIFFSVDNLKYNQEYELAQARLVKIQTSLNDAPILAKAISVYNLSRQQKIYGKNDEVPLPIASLAKIMTVMIALNTHPKDAVVTITPEAIKQAGDYGLYVNERWKIADLAKLTLISSANDGAYVIAEGPDFLQKITEKSKKIGAPGAYFSNPTGLDIEAEGKFVGIGAEATASDINAMAAYALLEYPEVFSVTVMPEINLVSESGFLHNFKNTNVILDKIPNLLFSKTGFTDNAGGSLVVVFKDSRGETLAVTILGSTFDGRFTDMEKIVNLLVMSK